MRAGKIAITIGDPAGVGCEIIAALLAARPDLRRACAVLAHADFLRGLPADVEKVPVGDSCYRAAPGVPDDEGARVAFAALEEAAAGCAAGRYAAVVTAPISKAQMRKVGFDFQGHTEFFAARWGGTPVMSFAGEKIIVSLATWHIPLRDVPDSLDEGKIARAVAASDTLAKKLRGAEVPRIAVCGVNPHAGEGGIIGGEETEIINPILSRLREKYAGLSECLPPDTVFERLLKGEFDCAVAMYHDQALAPLKAVEFDKAVNISMNLPFLRVSPDHGTAFSIAGKGIASRESFARACELALRLA